MQASLISQVLKNSSIQPLRGIVLPDDELIFFALDLLQCTDNELMNLTYMTENLMERCRMSSWVIVSKALVTFHSLMSNGNEVSV